MTRTVHVIGASSGIGRALARQLADRGDRLVLSSRGKRALDETAEECRARGAAEVVVLPLDVRDSAAVETAVAAADADAVVLTSGVVSYGRFEALPPEIAEGVVRTNLLGAMHVSRESVRRFRERGRGTLVLTGSVLGDIAAPSMTPYVVSKWGVRALGRQLAIENRDLPEVRICVVSPGGVDTPIYRQAANYQGRPGRPPAPVDAPERVAAAVVQLLDRPRDRVSVGHANAVMRLGFALLPGVFDRLVGPLFDVLASKPGSAPPTEGNVLEAVDEGEAVGAGEGQGVRDLVGRMRGR